MATPKVERLADLLYFLILGWSILGFIAFLFNPRDATDPITGARSGMQLHTDAGTGCQYISVPGGGITPRLGVGGRHEGCGL